MTYVAKVTEKISPGKKHSSATLFLDCMLGFAREFAQATADLEKAKKQAVSTPPAHTDTVVGLVLARILTCC